MLVQLQNSPQKGPGHFVGTPAADFTFPGPADSLWCAVAVGGVSWIQEICPGSNGNSKKTKGPGWTIWEAKVVFFVPPLEVPEKSTFMAGPRDR